MSMPVNWRTMTGPFTNAYASLVMTTKSINPSSSAGPDTAGPSTIANVGTTPEHRVSVAATRPHRASAAMPFADVGAGAADHGDERNPLRQRRAGGDLQGHRLRGGQRPAGVVRHRTRPTTTRRPPSSRTRAEIGARYAAPEIDFVEGHARTVDAGQTGALEGKQVAAEVHAGLFVGVRAHDVDQDRGATAAVAALGPGRRRADPRDDAAGEFGHHDPVEVALDLPGRGGGRNDRRAVAVEGERRQQPHAVDLGLGPQRDVGARRRAVEHASQRGALRAAAAAARRRARSATSTRARRAGASCARAGTGLRRTAARPRARGRRSGGG